MLELDVHLREFQSSFFSINPENIDDIKTEIRDFHAELVKKYHETGPRSKVAQISTQFFPVQKVAKTGKFAHLH